MKQTCVKIKPKHNLLKKLYYYLLRPYFNKVYNCPRWDITPSRGEVLYSVWKKHSILGYFLKYDSDVAEAASSPMFSGCRTVEDLNKNEDYVKHFGKLETN
jgi:hypothetical protein